MSNRLGAEKSPYLLQHAANPVDWFPWGEEAFGQALAQDRPVFLSIGYSTCHWCHVMERESFEDPDVARLMNETFISVKVDREERPDVDAVYMTVCQLMTGSGGWPLTVLLTPDAEPFFAGTYFPRTSRHGRIGMLDLIPRVRELWTSRRDDLVRSAARIREVLERAGKDEGGDTPGGELLDEAYRSLRAAFDPLQGGFGRAPKFPSPHSLSFLLRYWKRTGKESAREMVETTLRSMRSGGIYDHIGFGFHRYSTDARWFVPHFEKMLYDQALLTLAYVEAFQAAGDSRWARTAAEVVEYVLRDMVDEGGAFHSAEDADSEGEEGRFYTWTDDELREVLDPEPLQLVREAFNVVGQGNYADEATGRRTGRNILHTRESRSQLAARLGHSERELTDRLEAARLRLLEARSRRVRPHLDDKVLTDWNGLMIAALARTGGALGEPGYVDAAETAASFVLSELRDGSGRLLHRYRDGEAAIAAMADDYAFLAWGLLELHAATGGVSWLEAARQLTEQLVEDFADPDAGGFFLTAHLGEKLLVRSKEHHDGAVPSANSVATANLLRLARLTGDAGLEERAAATMRALGSPVALAPASHAHFLSALDFALGPAREIVVVGARDDAATKALLTPLRRSFLPRAVTLLKDESSPEAVLALRRLAPFTDPLATVEGRPAAYVCRDFACETPVTDPDELEGLLAD
jgi:uncharacterized protein YyaL (SSP411 family)